MFSVSVSVVVVVVAAATFLPAAAAFFASIAHSAWTRFSFSASWAGLVRLEEIVRWGLREGLNLRRQKRPGWWFSFFVGPS